MSTNSNNNDKLRWHQRVILEVLWATCCTIGFMPRWFRYGIFKPFVYAVVRLLRYRRKIVYRNIRLSFPEKSEKEIKHIVNGSYSTLAEVIVDTICLAGAKRRGDLNHVTWINRDEHMARTAGRDWIAMASHYGCWEYYPLWSWVDHDGRFLCVYHPLKSPVFEKLFRRMRQYTPNVELVPMANTLRQYLRIRSSEYSTVLGLISDQSPQLTADSQWYDFLNQKTTFISGGERLALRFGLPVYFCDVTRRSVGCYHVSFIPIYDGVESVEEGEITRRYVELLEKMIRRSPELWMWSHKRWKYTPEKQALMFGKSTLK